MAKAQVFYVSVRFLAQAETSLTEDELADILWNAIRKPVEELLSELGFELHTLKDVSATLW